MIKYLDFVVDVLSSKPRYAQGLLGRPLQSQEAKEYTANQLFSLLVAVLDLQTLGVKVRKSLRKDDPKSARLRNIFSAAFESILKLAQMSKAFPPSTGSFQPSLLPLIVSDISKCSELLHAVLSLLSTEELINSVGTLLGKPDDEVSLILLLSCQC